MPTAARLALQLPTINHRWLLIRKANSLQIAFKILKYKACAINHYFLRACCVVRYEIKMDAVYPKTGRIRYIDPNEANITAIRA